MRGPRSNLTTPKDSQSMIFYTLVYHPKPLGPIVREISALFMTDKETPVAAILFCLKRGQKYFQSRFYNEEHILLSGG